MVIMDKQLIYIFILLISSLLYSKEKIETNNFSKYKVVYTVVALADNKNQGIIPVPKLIGNGEDARNNLYWGAMYGVKTYFHKSRNWRLIKTIKNPNSKILERIILKHKKEKIIFIADAFRGVDIKSSIIEFLLVTAGKKIENFDTNFELNKPNLVVYIGHNGLMDFDLNKDIKLLDNGNRDTIILACKSKAYFKDVLSKLNVKSMLLTNGFMAPEAYTLHDVIESWSKGQKLKEAAAQAYNKYQKCGIKGARGLFYYEKF
jgi:hypothetical protein